jgi:hypothetical protein
MDADRLLDEEREGWERFWGIVERIDPDRLIEPTVTPGGWSPKDVLAHVGAWLEACAQVLEAMALGTWDPDAYDGSPEAVERFNAERAEAARPLEPAQVWAELPRQRERARSAFRSLDAIDAIDVEAWSWFEESGPMHYAKHAHDLLAFARGIRPDPEVGPLLQAETDGWLAFAGALASIPSAVLERPGPDGWSARDTMHHVAAWLEHAAPAVGANGYWYAGGPPAPADLVDRIDEGFRRSAQEVTAAAARDALERARARMREGFSSLTAPSDLAKHGFRIATIEHYADHLDQVRALRGSCGAPA